MSDENFVRVPPRFIPISRNLQGGSVRVMNALCLRQNNETDICWPSWETIASDTGLGRTSVFKSLKELEKAGMIEIKVRPGETSYYRIIHVDPDHGSKSESAPVHSSEPLPVQPSEPLPFTPVNPRGSAQRTPPVHSSEPKLDSRTKPKNETQRTTQKSDKKNVSDDVLNVFEQWNLFAKTAGLTVHRRLKAGWPKKIKERLATAEWIDEFNQALEKLPLGDGEGWQPDLEWMIRNNENALKVVEGKYDFRNSIPQKGNRNGTNFNPGFEYDESTAGQDREF